MRTRRNRHGIFGCLKSATPFTAVLVLSACMSTESFFLKTQSTPLTKPVVPHGLTIGSPGRFKGYDFSRIDARAVSAPESAAVSPRAIVAYLTADAKNELERTRAIFIWVAEHVAYDGKAFSVNDIPDMTPEEVFLARKGVCWHYSILFEFLASYANLQTKTLVGKALGYPSSILLGDTGHAWNAVQIDSAWYLLDVTWSAGGLDQSFQFHKASSHEAYWLSDPALFARSHFPEDPLWQLLEPPLTWSRFMGIAAENTGG